MDYRPVIIIGAPRSGTNMLRDVLTRFHGVETWPCDEINYIWRHGNVRAVHDEFPADFARPGVIRYVRAQFDKLARRRAAHTVVEKTCANSMRVAFVERIFPDAKFIFICRNGLDVVASAAKRWKAPLDVDYLARKARYVPVSDLPYYASRYAFNRVHKLLSSKKRLAFWGPRPADSANWAGDHDILEICAMQWQKSVDNSLRDFEHIDAARVHRVRYEDFVTQPAQHTADILSFLELDSDLDTAASMTDSVSVQSVGRGRGSLDDEQHQRVIQLVAATNRELGY